MIPIDDTRESSKAAALPSAVAPSTDALLKMRFDFAEKCFSNAQDLSRLMDQKAGYLLSAVGLLTTALGIVASKALDVEPAGPWHIGVKSSGLVFFLAYVLTAFMVIYNATRVFQAHSRRMQSQTAAPGLIFPLTVLGRYRSQQPPEEEVYYNRLVTVGPDDVFRDLADQIIEVSNIYRQKQTQVNRGTRLFAWLVIFWVVTILLFLATIIVH